jgi:DNA repair exonuclease SbcCD ATPase subunit
VSQKEQVADKYQRLLKEARGELQAATEAHKAQVASLTSKLHSQADSELSRLKKAALEAVNPPRPLHLTDSQLDRLRELEELTEEQGRANTQLRREVQEIRHEMEQDKKVSKTRLTKVQQELSDARAQHQKEVAGT